MLHVYNIYYRSSIFYWYCKAVVSLCLCVCLYPPFFRHDCRTATKFGTHIRIGMALALT